MTRTVAAWILLAPLLIAAPVPDATAKEKFIDNGKIKIGIDLSSGGSIFWFSESPGERNLMNHADRGRFIQQSYYGKPDGSLWVKKPWRWNPVQGGDYKGKPAKLVEFKETADQLYVRSIPVNWAGGGRPRGMSHGGVDHARSSDRKNSISLHLPRQGDPPANPSGTAGGVCGLRSDRSGLL